MAHVSMLEQERAATACIETMVMLLERSWQAALSRAFHLWREDVRAEVERCMSLGKSCPGYVMCISGHIPPNIPVENALYYYDVYNELGRR